jgi:hypothetical protein
MSVRQLGPCTGMAMRTPMSGREELALKINRRCLIVLPLLFNGLVAWSIFRSAR